MMQVRWGSHGDYRIIALCPNSPQECFDLTFQAFNLAEEYRVPVFVMLDEVVGHMTEKVVIPKADELEVTPRKFTQNKPGTGTFKPFLPGANMVPDMCKAGDGYRIHVTGLTHDERGYPAMTLPAQDKLVRRLLDKIDKNAEKIIRVEEKQMDGAEVVVVSYGITSRVAERAMSLAREKGAKVGGLRLITAWPFPERRVRELSTKIKGFVVPEINMGQMVLEVERLAAGKCKTRAVTHPGGTVHNPQVIADAIMEVAR
jgi:2-oxoglutarate ferredoxin oxidoreductase subunit alpha